MANGQRVNWRLARSAYVLRQLVELPGKHAASELGIEIDRLYALEAEYILAVRTSPARLGEAHDEFLTRFHTRLSAGALAERIGISPREARTRLDELGLEPGPPPNGSVASIRERIGRRKAEGASLHEGVVRLEEPDLLEAARARFGSWREALSQAPGSPIPPRKPHPALDEDRARMAWALRRLGGVTERDIAQVLGVDRFLVAWWIGEIDEAAAVSNAVADQASEAFLRRVHGVLSPPTIASSGGGTRRSRRRDSILTKSTRRRVGLPSASFRRFGAGIGKAVPCGAPWCFARMRA